MKKIDIRGIMDIMLITLSAWVSFLKPKFQKISLIRRLMSLDDRESLRECEKERKGMWEGEGEGEGEGDLWPGRGPGDGSLPCNQLYNIAFPGLLGSDVPTVQVSLIHVTPWTVIAKSKPPLALDAQIQATASLFILLDVPVFHRQSYSSVLIGISAIIGYYFTYTS